MLALPISPAGVHCWTRCIEVLMATPFSPGVPLPAVAGAAGAVSATPAAPITRVVTVFGASWAKPESPLYALSEAVGAALARRGFGVVCGGYYGTMEGVCKGAAAAHAESRRVGVLVPSLFRHRKSGNEVSTAKPHRCWPAHPQHAPGGLTRIVVPRARFLCSICLRASMPPPCWIVSNG